MRKLTRILSLLLCLVIASSAFAGCDGKKDSGGDKPSEVAVTSVTLSSKKVEIALEDSVKLTATVLPENATNKKVEFSSSDNSIIAVDSSGTVTALGLGTATVTAKSQSGALTDTCEVTVLNLNEVITAAELVKPTKVEYMLNEPISLEGGKIKVTYLDESKGDVALTAVGVTISGFDSAAAGTKTVTVSYKTYTFKYDVTITSSAVTFIAPTLKQAYRGSVKPNLAGGKFVLSEGGESRDIPLTDELVKVSYDSKKAGNTTVTVTYNNGAPYTYQAEIINKVFTSADLKSESYIYQMADSEFKVTSEGVIVTDKQALNMSINTEVRVYGIKVSLSSVNPDTCFVIQFDDNEQCKYTSNWRGQLQETGAPLHNVNGLITGAVAGEFNAYIQIKGASPLYWGNMADAAATKLSSKQLVPMSIQALTTKAESSVTVKDITFLNEADFKEAIKPKGSIDLTTEPTKKTYTQGFLKEKIDLAGGVFTVVDDNGDSTTVNIPNGKVTVKAYDNVGTTVGSVTTGSITLAYQGLEDKDFKYNITLENNEFDFNKLLDPTYQAENMIIAGSGSVNSEGGKLNLINTADWATVFIGSMPGKDTIGFFAKLEFGANEYSFIDIRYKDIILRYHTNNQPSGKFEGFVKLTDMATPWNPADPAKIAIVAKAITDGEAVQLCFSCDAVNIKKVSVVDFDFVNQAEYDEGTMVGEVSFSKEPTKKQYVRGIDKSKINLAGGEFTVVKGSSTQKIELPSSKVNISTFDNQGVKSGTNYSSKVFLKFNGDDTEYSYDVTLVSSAYSFANILDSAFQQDTFMVGNNGSFATQDGKLKVTNNHEWTTVDFPTMAKADAVGIKINFTCPANEYLLVDFKYNGRHIRFNSNTVAIGSYEGYALFSGMQNVATAHVNGIADIQAAIAAGETISVSFVLNSDPRVQWALISDFAFVSQAEYNAAKA